jgi:hypothetical protein
MTKHAALDAVNELVRPHTMRIQVTPTHHYTVHAPCLLRQLASCITLGAERGGRGIPGSRAPVNTDVLDLWHEIAHNTHAWALNIGGIQRRDPHDTHPIPWIGRLLRTTTSTAISKGYTDIADRIDTNAHRWADQINTIVTGTPEIRGVRGATCPECTQLRPYPLDLIGPRTGPQPTMWVVETRPGEGEVRVPAIVLAVRQVEGTTLRWLTCLACGWSVSLDTDQAAATLAWTSDERIAA